MNDILNDVIMSKDLVDALFSMDEDVVKACDNKAKEICVSLFPDIDLTREENVELVIRPMSSVIALNELLLQNIFSFASINGVYLSTTITDSVKIKLIRNYAILSGINTVSSDLESLYSEVKFAMEHSDLNRVSNLEQVIGDSNSGVDRLFFSDISNPEMTRNKIPYLQINNLEIMDFSRTDHNGGTLIGTAYNREDYQRYQDFQKSRSVEFPGVLDIYFSTAIEHESIMVSKGMNGRYDLPEGYYIYAISKTKDYIATEEDSSVEGIVARNPSLYIVNGEQEEELFFARYNNIDFGSIVDASELSIMDVLYKGFYPIFVDFNIYSRGEVDENRIKDSIDEYLLTVGGSMSMVSHNNMSDFVRARGDNVVISSTNSASVFTRMNIAFDTDITFPLSREDLSFPIELINPSITEQTIKIFNRSINVIQE